MVFVMTPEEVETRTPEEELAELEKKALELDISSEELQEIQTIGDCPDQIQARIAELQNWISGKTS